MIFYFLRRSSKELLLAAILFLFFFLHCVESPFPFFPLSSRLCQRERGEHHRLTHCSSFTPFFFLLLSLCEEDFSHLFVSVPLCCAEEVAESACRFCPSYVVVASCAVYICFLFCCSCPHCPTAFLCVFSLPCGRCWVGGRTSFISLLSIFLPLLFFSIFLLLRTQSRSHTHTTHRRARSTGECFAHLFLAFHCSSSYCKC